MTDHEIHEPLDVLVAGGGVAGLEAAFALRRLAGDRVAIRLLAPGQDFVYRPLAVGEPFTFSHVERYPLAPLAAAGAELIGDALASVDPERRIARTEGGAELSYDALVLGLGARQHPAFPHATTFDDARAEELLRGLVQDIEGGYVSRLAIVVPAPVPWPFPAYELALMASERAWDMQVELDVTVLTPERAPLDIFGAAVSRELQRMLTERRVEVVTSAYCEIPRSQLVVVHPGGRSVAAERIIALPQLSGPALEGLPQDGGGFIPVDETGRVRGVDHVWAAGDATDVPIKQGGVAAQLADIVAAEIAALTGATTDVAPLAPTLEGVLMTGGTPRYLYHRPATATEPAESAFTELDRERALPKIAARHLGPRLREASATRS